MTPQEVDWSQPLDEDDRHATFDPVAVDAYFAAATGAAQVLAATRAPYRGRSTPVNAWWGSFDLAVSLFSGVEVEPPAGGFIMRNAGDAEQIEIGWWPGDARYPKAAFFAYAFPSPEGFENAALSPEAARWDADLGEFILDSDGIDDALGAAVRAIGRAARVRGVRMGPGPGGQRLCKPYTALMPETVCPAGQVHV